MAPISIPDALFPADTLRVVGNSGAKACLNLDLTIDGKPRTFVLDAYGAAKLEAILKVFRARGDL